MIADIQTRELNGDLVRSLPIEALPNSENRWPLRPFQIVSLLDMLQFQAELFVDICSRLGQIEKHCHLADPNKVISDTDRQYVTNLLADVKWVCEQTGLKMSLLYIDSLDLSGTAVRETNLLPIITALVERIMDELSLCLLLQIPTGEADRFSNPRKGWEKIIERFPSTVVDVEEAWKCFALSRYSAAVFHSVQIVEAGLIEIGKFIAVSDPLSGWTAVSQRLKQIIEKRHPDRSEFEKNNFPFLEQLQGTVEALKNAWRNKISHSQGRLALMLGEEFHPDVAEEILLATRAFMRRLAEGLPKSVHDS